MTPITELHPRAERLLTDANVDPNKMLVAESEAKWKPIRAAWKAAQLCDDLASVLPDALHDAASQEAYLLGLSTDPTIVAGLASMLQRKAKLLREANPLPPITDEQREEFHKGMAECYDEPESQVDLSVELHTDADIASWFAEQDVLEQIYGEKE